MTKSKKKTPPPSEAKNGRKSPTERICYAVSW